MKATLSAIIIALLLMMGGCSTTPSGLRSAIDTIAQHQHPYIELKRIVASSRIIGPLDDHYICYSSAEWPAHIANRTMGYQGDAWDCDDMAFEVMSKSRRDFYLNSEKKSTPAIGVALVSLNKTFLGLEVKNPPAKHALCVIFTSDKGWMFFEEQTRKSCRMYDAVVNGDVTVDYIIF